MSISDIEQNIKKALEATQSQALNQSQAQGLILGIQKELNQYKDYLDRQKKDKLDQMNQISKELKNIANFLATNVKDLEDIPGVRTPKMYEVNIEFDYQDTSLKFNSIEINPEGPFLITQITPLWEVRDSLARVISPGVFETHFANTAAGVLQNPPNGTILPCTAYPMILNSFGIANTTGLDYNTPSYAQLFNRYSDVAISVDNNRQWGVLSDIPEFDFQIEVAGSGRYFTNQPISAASLYGYMGQPMFMGVQGWADRGDKLVIHATPTVPVPHKGLVRFCLHGYQILGNISISKALGYGDIAKTGV